MTKTPAHLCKTYFGTPPKEKMLALAENLLKRRSSKRNPSRNYRSSETIDHGEKRANEIIAAGLKAFDLEEEALAELKKSSTEKFLIAAIVRRETAVKVAWLAKRLTMGSASNVSRATSAIPALLATEPKLKKVTKTIYATMAS